MATLIERLGEITNLDDTEANNIAARSVIGDYLADIVDTRSFVALNTATGLSLSAEDLATLVTAIKAAFDSAFKAAFLAAVENEDLVDRVTANLWNGGVETRKLFREFLKGPVDSMVFIAALMNF
jgi:hypothetical protein